MGYGTIAYNKQGVDLSRMAVTGIQLSMTVIPIYTIGDKTREEIGHFSELRGQQRGDQRREFIGY